MEVVVRQLGFKKWDLIEIDGMPNILSTITSIKSENGEVTLTTHVFNKSKFRFINKIKVGWIKIIYFIKEWKNS